MLKGYVDSIKRGTLLVLMAAMLAGCGGAANTPVANLTATVAVGNTGEITAPTATPNQLASEQPTADTSGSTSSGAGLDLTNFDTCSLLQDSEILAVMPKAVLDHTDTDFDPVSGTKTCTFAMNEGTGMLQLTLYTPNRWADEASITGTNPQPVPGLGDAAVTESLTYAQVLAVLVRDKAAFLLTFSPTYTADGNYDKKQAGDVTMQLAKLIIPRLK